MEHVLHAHKSNAKESCPFCFAEKLLDLPLHVMHNGTFIHKPERCLRCGAEWVVVYSIHSVMVTSQGRPMEPRKSNKSQRVLAVTKYEKAGEELPAPSTNSPMVPYTKIVADGTQPGVTRGS